MNLPGWAELAAMMTVVAIFGGAFTGIVSMVVDKKLTQFAVNLRRDFVTQKEMEFLVKKVDEQEERWQRSCADLWIAIHEIRTGK